MTFASLVSRLADIECDRFVLEKEADFGIRYRILKPFSNQVVFTKVFDSPTDAKCKDLAISSRFEEYLVEGSLLDWAREASLTVEIAPYPERIEVALKQTGFNKGVWLGRGNNASMALIEAWIKFKESNVVVPEIREIQIA